VRKLAPLVVLALLLALPSAAGAEVTREQLAEADAEVRRISAEMEDRIGDLEAALYEEWDTGQRIVALEVLIDERERQIALAEVYARERAVDLYMELSFGHSRGTLDSDGATEAGIRAAYLDAISEEDRDAAIELEFLQADQARLVAELETLQGSQAVARSDVEQEVADIMAELEQANAEYQALWQQWQVEEAERIRQAEEARRAEEAAAAAAAAAATGYMSSAATSAEGRTCPVAGPHSFRDSWLEPRPGGRLHHGTDMVAARGTPVVAIESGTIFLNWHWAGGIGLYVYGDSGDVYYYAHLDSYAGVGDGERVTLGQVVGYVGSTGNASVPHLHIGYQPGGGPLTNPYQLMVKLCR
jgi:murein DD-endopeptidase MepM/ murein hydrolase activator NlpD